MSSFSKIASMDGFVSERFVVHRDKLLGNYDQGGKYTISNKIIKELMQMRKIKKHTYDNSLFCISDILGIGEILFEIKYSKKAVGKKASSKIYVLEDVYKVNGYYINTIRTQIGEFVSTVDNYLQKSYDYYNVVLVDDEEGRERLGDTKNDYPYVTSKKEYDEAVYRTISDKMEKSYKDLFDSKMAIIKGESGSFASGVAEGYTNEYNAINSRFLTANGDNNYIAYNDLLDKVIEDRDGVIEAEASETKELYVRFEKPISDLAKNYAEVLVDADKQAKKMLGKGALEKYEELEQEVIDTNRLVKKSPAYDCGVIYNNITTADMEKDVLASKNLKSKEKVKDISSISSKLKSIVRSNKTIIKEKELER